MPVVDLFGESDVFENIQNLGRALQKAGHDTDVNVPIPSDPENRQRLDDAAVHLGVVYGRAG